MKGKMTSELPRRRSTVAIKRIWDRNSREREDTFIAQIETLSRCMHPNIASLLGFCNERPHMIFVFEHASNGSLDDYLRNKEKRTNLTWVQRIKICIDIARGLDYLHTPVGVKQKLIHSDLKSANILLGKNLEAKIVDFSSTNFHLHDHMTSQLIVDTNVYMDPEYEKTNKMETVSDVYSFGVVLFEILTGRLAYDPFYSRETRGLATMVRQHFERGTLKELVDPTLNEKTDEKNISRSRGPNEDSLRAFYEIGYKCLSEMPAQRPSMKDVIHELYRALYFQRFPSSLKISFEDIKRATKDFNITNLAGIGGFGRAYRGEMLLGDEPTHVVAKRNDAGLGQGEDEFFTEIEILFEYKHENVISLLGYCRKKNERILVYEYASNGSLDRHVKHASLTWMKRLKICIEVAMGLDFLHRGGSTQAPVIHRDIKSTNILLNGDWKAKIGDFGLSIITPGSNEFDVVSCTACGTYGYVDPKYFKKGLLSRESDIYSLGVVLLEMMCGRIQDPHKNLVDLVKSHYEEGRVAELVFQGIKDKIVPKSLTTYLKIAYQCLSDEREDRPTASEVVLQLNKALEFQVSTLHLHFTYIH
ncbi:putative protein kinase RLK-Pelle-LRR-I-1 family [Helianthus annuus]|nr:putative protein kinase RLK-Pelle-LRR-I-1 family [Helianthus annuus]KAJ0690846.1 putative protein kinase RLK-Pelle-LRR-I-1 family [Helianthus annuus]